MVVFGCLIIYFLVCNKGNIMMLNFVGLSSGGGGGSGFGFEGGDDVVDSGGDGGSDDRDDVVDGGGVFRNKFLKFL